jgi:hypothetical protein
MSVETKTSNIRYVTAGQSLITMEDDVINCDSAAGPIILILPGIQGSGILTNGKCFKINDISNTAGTNNITIAAIGGNKINDGAGIILNANGQSGYVKCLGLNDYLFDTTISTGGGSIGGGGTLNYIAKWTPNGLEIGNSILFEYFDGFNTNIGIGTISAIAKLQIYGDDDTINNSTFILNSLSGNPLFDMKNSGDLFVGKKLNIYRYNFNPIAAFSIETEATTENTLMSTTSADLVFLTKNSGAAETCRITKTGIFSFVDETYIRLGSLVPLSNNYGYISTANNVTSGVGLKFEICSPGVTTPQIAMQLENTGHVITKAVDNAIADGALQNGQMSNYINQASNSFIFKVKYDDGTIKTVTLPLV